MELRKTPSEKYWQQKHALSERFERLAPSINARRPYRSHLCEMLLSGVLCTLQQVLGCVQSGPIRFCRVVGVLTVAAGTSAVIVATAVSFQCSGFGFL